MEKPWEFSPLDRTIMPFYYAYIFGFPTSSSEELITSILQHGLSKIVAKYPFLNGVVTRTDGCLSLDVPEPVEEIKIIRKSW